MHLPQVQYFMPASQYKAESGHCISEEVSQSSKYFRVALAGDQLLRLFAGRIEFFSLVQSLYQTSHGSGAGRTVESVFLTVSLRFEFSFLTVE